MKSNRLRALVSLSLLALAFALPSAQALKYPDECYDTIIFGVEVVRCHQPTASRRCRRWANTVGKRLCLPTVRFLLPAKVEAALAAEGLGCQRAGHPRVSVVP